MSSNDKIPTGKLVDYCDKIDIVRIEYFMKSEEYEIYTKDSDKEFTKNTIFIQYEFSGQEQKQHQSFTESLMTIPKYKPYSPSGFYWCLELNPEKVKAKWVHQYLIQKILSDKSYFHRFLTPQNTINENITCNKCHTNVKFFLPLYYNKSRFPLGYFLRGISRKAPELTTPLPIFPQSISRKNLKKDDLIYHSQLYQKQNDYYIQNCSSCNKIILNSGYDYDKNAEEIAELSFAMNVRTFHSTVQNLSMKSYKKLSKITFPPNSIPYTTSVFPRSSLSDIQIPIKSLDDQEIDLKEDELTVSFMITEQERRKTRYSTKTVRHSLYSIIEEKEGNTHEVKETLSLNQHTGKKDESTNNKTGKKHNAMEFSVLKTISAFANTDGGTIIIGIKDEKNRKKGWENDENKEYIIGINNELKKLFKNSEDEFNIHFKNLIRDHLSSQPYNSTLMKAENFIFEPYFSKILCIIKCPKNITKHPILNDGILNTRIGSSSEPLDDKAKLEFYEQFYKNKK